MPPRRRKSLDPANPAEAAALASLHHTSDDIPGITRKRVGKDFSYADPAGRIIRDRQILSRIRSLAIPPAWEKVWISPRENGHIQATGRDARGRKQYRYHPRWQKVRDENKYDRLVAFGQALPGLRKAVSRDLASPQLTFERAVATVVALLEKTFIRIGGREYARDNDSFGLTTLLDRHVNIAGSEVRFRFRGKSGKDHVITVRDRRIARLVKQCRDLPGQTLFQYLDGDDTVRAIDAADVNDYLHRHAGPAFTAKDYRTWGGTLLAAITLSDKSRTDDVAPTASAKDVISLVAKSLGNTAAICRKCYIHPNILAALTDSSERERWLTHLDKATTVAGLTQEESALLTFCSAIRK